MDNEKKSYWYYCQLFVNEESVPNAVGFNVGRNDVEEELHVKRRVVERDLERSLLYILHNYYNLREKEIYIIRTFYI